MQRLVLACIYTRHHDGFVRHDRLSHVLGSGELWTAPFILRLIGEYVVEIVISIAGALAADPGIRHSCVQVAAENPDFIELTRQRAVSYWDCYYRRQYPRLGSYPGMEALHLIDAT